MSIEEPIRDARRFVAEAIDALGRELDYGTWTSDFGVPLSNAQAALADAGFDYADEDAPAVARSKDAIREALERVDALLERAWIDSASWRIDIELDPAATPPPGNPRNDAYSLLQEALNAGFAVRDAE